MPYQLFSATGCVRCKMVKSFMDEKKITYEEYDIKSEGKDKFKSFYKKNRPDIFRGKQGIEFPILYDGGKILQGVGPILAFLLTGDNLNDFVKRSDLTHGWISGLNICTKGLQDEENFLYLLQFLKQQGLMIQMEADGQNPKLLEALLKGRLIDRLIFYLRGTADFYKSVTGMSLTEEDLFQSLSLIDSSVEYKIILPVSVFYGKNGDLRFLTPEEASQAAELVKKATGSTNHPFFIAPVNPLAELSIEPLPASAFFKYRTLCRRYMVSCEIET